MTSAAPIRPARSDGAGTLTFLQGLDEDIRDALIRQLRNLWTHTSTAIEGNTLDLGETAFVIEEGLTVSGKPIKDHLEVTGHARAIDLIYNLLDKERISRDDLFALHKAVQTELILDVYKPIGNWKNSPNGTIKITDGRQVYVEYPSPVDIPALMEKWINMMNLYVANKLEKEEALRAYAELHVSFVQIHPFFDGNGRMARLVANLPVIKSGFPPILIPKEKRREYLQALAKYDSIAGLPTVERPLVLHEEGLRTFKALCLESWRISMELVEQAEKLQAKRRRSLE